MTFSSVPAEPARDWLWSIIAGLAMVASAAGQYGDPSAGDADVPGIHYFGAVKDDNGLFLSGATITLTTEWGRYVFVTNDEGRFRGNLPVDMVPEKVSPQCFKAGFQLMGITKRPGANGAKINVQVDCVLRAQKSG
jgi:hypothetical protein